MDFYAQGGQSIQSLAALVWGNRKPGGDSEAQANGTTPPLNRSSANRVLKLRTHYSGSTTVLKRKAAWKGVERDRRTAIGVLQKHRDECLQASPDAGGKGACLCRQSAELLPFSSPAIDGYFIQIDIRPCGSTAVSVNLEIGYFCRIPSECVSGEDGKVQVLFSPV